MDDIRYPACPCEKHRDQLSSIPNRNVRLSYGSCARTCVFCETTYTKASKLRHTHNCLKSSNIHIHTETKGARIHSGHTWCRLPGYEEEIASELKTQHQNEMKPVGFQSLPFRITNQVDSKTFHANDVQSLLEDLDESLKALIKDIPLSTVKNMSEETREEWKKSTTTWAQTFPSVDFFDKDPPSSETLIRDILKPGPISWTAFCKGDRDPDIDPISVISQLHEPNPKKPLAIMGIRPSTISTDPIFTPPVYFSEIVEPFDVGNQQILLTTKFWETDVHLDHLDGLSATLGPGKKLWLTFPPTNNNIRLLIQAEGRKAKLRRIGKDLQHGLIHTTTSSDLIFLPIGCIHYVVSTHGGFLITMDFIAPDSSRALSSLILSGVDRSNTSWQRGLFENFRRSIELGLNNNQISNALFFWIRIQELIKEWAEKNIVWKKDASKVWDSFFRSTLSKNVSCPCGTVESNQSFEEHFRAVHMFAQPGIGTSFVRRPRKRRDD